MVGSYKVEAAVERLCQKYKLRDAAGTAFQNLGRTVGEFTTKRIGLNRTGADASAPTVSRFPETAAIGRR